MKKYKLRDSLPSAVICLAILILAASGALYFKNRVRPQKEPPAFQQASSVVADLSTEYMTTSVESTVQEYITEAESFEAYSFIPLSADLQMSIYAACTDYEIAYDLILAVIKTESEFDAAAIGDSGNAYGLMQIQPRWWDWLAVEKRLTDYRTDPVQNAALGIAILSLLLDENAGDLDKALIAYNGGADYPAKVYANYEWVAERTRHDR